MRKPLGLLNTNSGSIIQRTVKLATPLIIVLLYMVGQPSLSLAGDGRLQWRTIETRHFRIHFPSHLNKLAHRTAVLCEDAFETLSPLFRHKPTSRIDVSLTDFGDASNGSATAIPSPRMVLFAAPPRLDSNLGNYDDWLKLLIYHEFTHILQLDQVAGVPKFLNQIFGRLFVPNQNLPSFVLEGGAVWAESKTTGFGRIKSALFTGTLRAQALADRLHDMARMTHIPPDWPDANIWYMYGGHFVHWLVSRYGSEWIRIIHGEIADDLLPFGINRATRKGTGETLVSLYRQWSNHLVLEARRTQRTLSKDRLSKLQQLSSNGRIKSHLRIGANGRLYSLESGHHEAAIVSRSTEKKDRHDPSPRIIFHGDGLQDFDLCGPGQIAFTRRIQFEGAYGYNDLYVKPIDTGPIRRITFGARLREITCSSTGNWLVAVQVIDGRTQLVRVNLLTGDISLIFKPNDGAQVALPRLSHDGKRLVVAIVDPSRGRDLFLMDTHGKVIKRLTHDNALEINPVFTPDDRGIIYASDRTGIFNIDRLNLDSGLHHRLTRVVTGATNPILHPHRSELFVTILTAAGYDIAYTRPLNELRDTPAALTAEANTQTGEPITAIVLPEKPYLGWTYMWPQNWSPTFAFSTATDLASNLGVDLEVSDPLAHHTLVALINSLPEESTVGFSGSYAYRRLRPTFGLSVAHLTRTRPTAAYYDRSRQAWRERVSVAGTSISLPMRLGALAVGTSIGYNLAWTRPAENIDPIFDPIDIEPMFPDESRSASLTLSLSLGNTDTFYDSISTEMGWAAQGRLRIRRPELGGDVESAEIFLNVRGYIPVIWRHVLALSTRAASGRGDGQLRPAYGFGAPAQRNVLFDALDEINMGNGFLRGYPTNAVTGNRYVFLRAEYRLPILDIFSGIETIPLFMKRFKLALFTDWVQASYEPLQLTLGRFNRSAGAEILGEAQIGWRIPMSIRLGYARGFLSAGEQQIYFFLGRWF